jgi:hypothetical protein
MQCFAVVKKYDVLHHFIRKHRNTNYSSLSENDLKAKGQEFADDHRDQKNIPKKQSSARKAAIKASYFTVYKIVNSNTVIS